MWRPPYNISGSRVAIGTVALAAAGGTIVGANQTDETGPILAFVAALVVAAVASRTATSNVSKQLDAEARRHEETLEKAARRQEELLDHERKLTDLQHFRELLDAAAAGFEEALAGVTAFASVLTSLAITPETLARRREVLGESVDGRAKMRIQLHRLEMRFPSDDPVLARYVDIKKPLDERSNDLWRVHRGGLELEDGNELWKRGVRLGTAAEDAFATFASAARREIGAREVAIQLAHPGTSAA